MKEALSFYEIQTQLKANKGQYNSFGKYNYRSCEDILESFKKLKSGWDLVLSDDVVSVGDRVYVKATASISFEGNTHREATAFAREPETKKGMDPSQITGTASSYARKYALNGLLCIDDTKDADTDEYSSKQVEKVNKSDPGSFVVTFGKDQGRTISDIAHELGSQELYNRRKFLLEKELNGSNHKAFVEAVNLYEAFYGSEETL